MHAVMVFICRLATAKFFSGLATAMLAESNPPYCYVCVYRCCVSVRC